MGEKGVTYYGEGRRDTCMQVKREEVNDRKGRKEGG